MKFHQKKRTFNRNSLFRYISTIFFYAAISAFVLISFFAILSAFGSYRLTCAMIETTLDDISETLKKGDSVENGQISPALLSYKEKLHAETKGILDSGTISFLFQIISIVLFSIGFYILAQIFENMKESEKKTKTLIEFILNTTDSSTIETLCSLIYSDIMSLKDSDSSHIDSFVSKLRENLSALRSKIILINKINSFIDDILIDNINDRVSDIESFIKDYSDLKTKTKREFKKYCADIKAVTNDKDFQNRINKRLEILLN